MEKKDAKLILMRHGQSAWNEQNLFTGWVDIPLSTKGIEEALEAGKALANIPIDAIFVSALVRAQMTMTLAMSCHKGGKIPVFLHLGEGKMQTWGSCSAQKECIPVYTSEALNERMYGELQGCNKKVLAEKYGQEQIKIWRRSYDTPPPQGESLKECKERALPYFLEEIVPLIKSGKNVLVVAHGNSLRGILMHMKGLSAEEVVSLEIPTGKPLFYTFQEGKWNG